MLNVHSLGSWRDEVGRHLLKLDFQPASDDPFSAAIEPLVESAQTRVTRTRISPGVLFRDAALARDGATSLALVYPRKGDLHVRHGGRDLQLRTGEASLLRNWEPGSMGASHRFDFVAVILPEQALVGADTEEAIARPIQRESEVLRLLRSYIALQAQSRFRLRHATADAIGRHLCDLVRLLANREEIGDESQEKRSVRHVRLEGVLAHIQDNFADPGLTAASVARAAGISVRYLERLLEASEQPYTGHVRELRLQRAYKLLADPAHCHRRIVDLALEAGFSDLSHFNRLFRQRFAETPSAVRPVIRGTSPRRHGQ